MDPRPLPPQDVGVTHIDGIGQRVGVAYRDQRCEPHSFGQLARIAAAGCDWFVDDLPEFLAEPDFPADVQRILFDPWGHCPTDPRWRRARSWAELEDIILCRTTLRA